MTENEITLRQNDDGKWDVFEPYTTIVVETEESFKFLKNAVKKATAEKPKEIKLQTRISYVCTCGITLKWVQHFPNEFTWGNEPDYCSHCGQKLKWEI